jgi:aspartyl protease family protein
MKRKAVQLPAPKSQRDASKRVRRLKRSVMLTVLLVPTIGALIASRNFGEGVRARTTAASTAPVSTTSNLSRDHEPTSVVQIPRGAGGEFSVQARINGITAPMVVDTGATSVVLTYETAKAIGFPLELLEYNIDVQTASGHTKAARLWLDRMVIGKLVERSVPALVVRAGEMKTNLLGMSFLDRLDSFEVRADQLMLHGFQEPGALHISRRKFGS